MVPVEMVMDSIDWDVTVANIRDVQKVFYSVDRLELRI